MPSLAKLRHRAHKLKPTNILEKIISSLVLGTVIAESEGFPVVLQFQAPSRVLQLDGNLLLRKPDVNVHLPMLYRHGELQPDLTGWHELVDMPCQGVLEVSFGVKDFSVFGQARQKTSDVQNTDLVLYPKPQTFVDWPLLRHLILHRDLHAQFGLAI